MHKKRNRIRRDPILDLVIMSWVVCVVMPVIVSLFVNAKSPLVGLVIGFGLALLIVGLIVTSQEALAWRKEIRSREEL